MPSPKRPTIAESREQLISSALVLELSVMIGEREGREPKQVAKNAERTRKRLAKKGITKSVIRILAEKEQPYQPYPGVRPFVADLRHDLVRAFRDRLPFIDPEVE